MVRTVYAVRVSLIDGGVVDILLFGNRAEAARHAEYLRKAAPDLGYDEITITPRLVIGLEFADEVPTVLPLVDSRVQGSTHRPKRVAATAARTNHGARV